MRFPDVDPAEIELPPIPPVPARGRPFWSVMIPHHRNEEYLAHALTSVLAQDPGPQRMQIEVVDDASPGREVDNVVKKIGRGRVGLHRNEVNQGVSGTFTTCIHRARGRWVHILHCDDWVLPGFYEQMAVAIRHHSGARVAMCRAFIADKDGRLAYIFESPPGMRTTGIVEDAEGLLRINNFVATPSIVVRRDLYEEVGGYAPGLAHAADWEMWMRLSRHSPVAYLDELLAAYRLSPEQHSAAVSIDGSAMDEYLRAVAMGAAHLAPDRRAEAFAQSRDFLATRAASIRGRMTKVGNRRAALRWAFLTMRLRPSGREAAHLIRAAAAYLGARDRRRLEDVPR